MHEGGSSVPVVTRFFESADVAAVHRWFNNQRAVASLMEQRAEFTLEQAEGWVERAVGSDGEDRKFAITIEGHDQPVGFTALYGLFRQTAPELGVMVGDDIAARGVGREAERQTVVRAFNDYGAHKVYGRIPTDNEAAQRAVAWMGWKHEGTMREHLRRPEGDLVGCEIWGVTRSDWVARWGDGAA